MPHSSIGKQTRRHAQQMRSAPTDAERKLWQIVRALKRLGFHFRRQAPIGKYIADFAWHHGKLVIELDGGQHNDVRRNYDSRWSAWLESQGYRVLRFWNDDVLRMPRVVGEEILRVARKAPPPTPPHKGEGSLSARAESHRP